MKTILKDLEHLKSLLEEYNKGERPLSDAWDYINARIDAYSKEERRKFRTVISVSYDIEAETPEEAEEKALQLFDEDLQKAIGEGWQLDLFGVNTLKVKKDGDT